MFRPHDPPRPLRGAMIGTGSIAVHHLVGWKAVPGVELRSGRAAETEASDNLNTLAAAFAAYAAADRGTTVEVPS